MTTVEQQPMAELLKTATFGIFIVKGEERKRLSFMPLLMARGWDELIPTVMRAAVTRHTTLRRNNTAAYLSDRSNWLDREAAAAAGVSTTWAQGMKAGLTVLGIQLGHTDEYIQVQQVGDVADAEAVAQQTQRLGTANQQTVPELLFDKLFWVNTSSLMSSLGLGFRAPIIAKGWTELTSVICNSIAKCREPLIWADVAKSLENPDNWQKDSKGAPTRLPELVVDKVGGHMSIAVMTPQLR